MDIYAEHREDAKKTPFFASPPMLCRCGLAPMYIVQSLCADSDGSTAAMKCTNPKCGAYGQIWKVKLVHVEGRITQHAYV